MHLKLVATTTAVKKAHDLAQQLKDIYTSRNPDGGSIEIIENEGYVFAEIAAKLLYRLTFFGPENLPSHEGIINTFMRGYPQKIKDSHYPEALDNLLWYFKSAAHHEDVKEFIRHAAGYFADHCKAIISSGEHAGLPQAPHTDGAYVDLATGIDFSLYFQQLSPRSHYVLTDNSPFVSGYLNRSVRMLGLQNISVWEKDISTLSAKDFPEGISLLRAENLFTYIPHTNKLIESLLPAINDLGIVAFLNASKNHTQIALFLAAMPALVLGPLQNWTFSFSLGDHRYEDTFDTISFQKNGTSHVGMHWTSYLTAIQKRWPKFSTKQRPA